MVEYSPLQESFRTLAKGATLDWQDEAEAWLRSQAGEGDREEILGDLRAKNRAFTAKNRNIAALLETIGSIPTMLLPVGRVFPKGLAKSIPKAGASPLNKIAQNPYVKGAGVGVPLGAVYGAGKAEKDKLTGAATGAMVGAGAGIAGVGAAKALNKATPFISALYSPGSQRAAQRKGTQGAATPQALIAQAARQIPEDSAYNALRSRLVQRYPGIMMQMSDEEGSVSGGRKEPDIQYLDESWDRYLSRWGGYAQENYPEEGGGPEISQWITRNFKNYLKNPKFRKRSPRVTSSSAAHEEATARRERKEDTGWFTFQDEENLPNAHLMDTILGSKVEGIINAPYYQDAYPWLKDAYDKGRITDDTIMMELVDTSDEQADDPQRESLFNLGHISSMLNVAMTNPNLPEHLKIKKEDLKNMSVDKVFQRIKELERGYDSEGPASNKYMSNLRLATDERTILRDDTLNLKSLPEGSQIFSVEGKPQEKGGTWIEIDYDSFTGRKSDGGKWMEDCFKINEDGGWCIRSPQVAQQYLAPDSVQQSLYTKRQNGRLPFLNTRNPKVPATTGDMPAPLWDLKLTTDILLDTTGRPHLQIHTLKDEDGYVREIFEIAPVGNSFKYTASSTKNKSRQEKYQKSDPEYVEKVSKSLKNYLNDPRIMGRYNGYLQNKQKPKINRPMKAKDMGLVSVFVDFPYMGEEHHAGKDGLYEMEIESGIIDAGTYLIEPQTLYKLNIKDLAKYAAEGGKEGNLEPLDKNKPFPSLDYFYNDKDLTTLQTNRGGLKAEEMRNRDLDQLDVLTEKFGEDWTKWPEFLTRTEAQELLREEIPNYLQYKHGGRVMNNRRRRGVPKNLFDLHARYYQEGTGDESVDAETSGLGSPGDVDAVDAETSGLGSPDSGYGDTWGDIDDLDAMEVAISIAEQAAKEQSIEDSVGEDQGIATAIGQDISEVESFKSHMQPGYSYEGMIDMPFIGKVHYSTITDAGQAMADAEDEQSGMTSIGGDTPLDNTLIKEKLFTSPKDSSSSLFNMTEIDTFLYNMTAAELEAYLNGQVAQGLSPIRGYNTPQGTYVDLTIQFPEIYAPRMQTGGEVEIKNFIYDPGEIASLSIELQKEAIDV